MAVAVAVCEEVVDVLLEAASTDSIAENGDFSCLSLRLLARLPVEVAEACAEDGEREEAGYFTANDAGLETVRGDGDGLWRRGCRFWNGAGDDRCNDRMCGTVYAASGTGGTGHGSREGRLWAGGCGWRRYLIEAATPAVDVTTGTTEGGGPLTDMITAGAPRKLDGRVTISPSSGRYGSHSQGISSRPDLPASRQNSR